jgi:hypothetical protein
VPIAKGANCGKGKEELRRATGQSRKRIERQDLDCLFHFLPEVDERVTGGTCERHTSERARKDERQTTTLSLSLSLFVREQQENDM